MSKLFSTNDFTLTDLRSGDGFVIPDSHEDVVRMSGTSGSGITLHLEDGRKAFAPTLGAVISLFGKYPEVSLKRIAELDPFVGAETAQFLRMENLIRKAQMIANGVDPDYLEKMEAYIGDAGAKTVTKKLNALAARAFEDQIAHWPLREPSKFVYNGLGSFKYLNGGQRWLLGHWFTRMFAPSETLNLSTFNIVMNDKELKEDMRTYDWEPQGIQIQMDSAGIEISQESGRQRTTLSPYEIVTLFGGFDRFEAYAARYLHHTEARGSRFQDRHIVMLATILRDAEAFARKIEKIEAECIKKAWKAEVGDKTIPADTVEAMGAMALARHPNVSSVTVEA